MKLFISILLFIISISGLLSQTTYIWNGAVNSNFSTAGNWTPTRQIGMTTDNLIFNSGTLLNITNVNQVTVGQLTVKNHTQLKLSPAAGNPRVISIQGESDSPGGNNNGYNEIADSKYREYMNEEAVQDIASQKYNEYMQSDSSINDIATLKYNEYKNPKKTGMGDIKYEEAITDSNSSEDLLIETGSSLTISANEPKLSIYLKQNATAAIYGSLIFQGEASHGINSYDMYAISFHEGSSLIQSCPGNIFSASGVNNSVLFDNGSVLEINHTGALDPFGMSIPSGKVSFYDESNLKLSVSSPAALKLNGRILPNIIIGEGCIITAHEILTNDITVNNLLIYPGGKLNIKNLSTSSVPNFNIKGNIAVNGELTFPEAEYNKLTVNLTGQYEHLISGSGVIDFNNSVYKLNVYNDIKLERDLNVYCHVFHHNGFINTNSHIFRIYNQYTSSEMIFVGIVIMQSLSKSNKGENNNTDNIKKETIKPNFPETYSISQNYPNPFNPKTKIDYALPKPSDVNITVYNLLGKEVASLVNNRMEPGNYGVEFDGSNFASGIYIYRIKTGEGAGSSNFSKTLKMVLAK